MRVATLAFCVWICYHDFDSRKQLQQSTLINYVASVVAWLSRSTAVALNEEPTPHQAQLVLGRVTANHLGVYPATT